MKCEHGLGHKMGSLLGSSAQKANLEKEKCKVSERVRISGQCGPRNMWIKLSERFTVK